MHRLAGWDWDGAGGAGAVTTEGLESSFGRQTHLEDPGSVTICRILGQFFVFGLFNFLTSNVETVMFLGHLGSREGFKIQ